MSGVPQIATMPSSPTALSMGAGVLEAAVGEVVGSPVRLVRRRGEATEAVPERQAHHLEGTGDRAVRRPHVGVAARRVVEREVGQVRAEKDAGAAHDRVEDPVGVTKRGQVARRLDQRGQLRLPAAAPVDAVADPQGEVALGLRGAHGRDVTGRGVVGEQAQKLQRGALRGGGDGHRRAV
jgi:hypothetical protein